MHSGLVKALTDICWFQIVQTNWPVRIESWTLSLASIPPSIYVFLFLRSCFSGVNSSLLNVDWNSYRTYITPISLGWWGFSQRCFSYEMVWGAEAASGGSSRSTALPHDEGSLGHCLNKGPLKLIKSTSLMNMNRSVMSSQLTQKQTRATTIDYFCNGVFCRLFRWIIE